MGGKQFGEGFKGSAKAFLAATSSVKSLVFVNPLQKNLVIWEKNFTVFQSCFRRPNPITG